MDRVEDELLGQRGNINVNKKYSLIFFPYFFHLLDQGGERNFRLKLNIRDWQ